MGAFQFVSQRNNPRVDSAFSWFMAISVCVFAVLVAAFPWSSGVLFVLIQDHYGISKQRAAYPLTTLNSTQLILGIFSGFFVHRLKTRKTLTLAVFLCVLGSVMSVFNPLNDPVTWLTICMTIRGMGSSLFVPVSMQVVSGHFEKHRAKALMLVYSFGPVSALILPYVMRVSAEEYGLESSWLIHAALYIQALPLAMIIGPLEEIQAPPIADLERRPIFDENSNSAITLDEKELKVTRTSKDGPLSLLKKLLRVNIFYVTCIGHFITFFTAVTFRTTVLDYGRDINLETTLNNRIFELMSFGDLVRIPIALVIDRALCSKENILVFGFLITVLALLFLTVATNYLYVIVACFYNVAYVICVTSLAPLFATLGTENVAVSFGISLCIQGVAQLFLPFLIGLFRDYYGSYVYLFYMLALLNAIMASVFGISSIKHWFPTNK